MRRPCLDCGRLGLPGRSRCAAHEAERTRAHNARRANTPGDGAARRLRYRIDRQGWAQCMACRLGFAATGLEVDHVVPLHQGGHDVDANVRPLCILCHRAKTTAERR